VGPHGSFVRKERDLFSFLGGRGRKVRAILHGAWLALEEREGKMVDDAFCGGGKRKGRNDFVTLWRGRRRRASPLLYLKFRGGEKKKGVFVTLLRQSVRRGEMGIISSCIPFRIEREVALLFLGHRVVPFFFFYYEEGRRKKRPKTPRIFLSRACWQTGNRAMALPSKGKDTKLNLRRDPDAVDMRSETSEEKKRGVSKGVLCPWAAGEGERREEEGGGVSRVCLFFALFVCDNRGKERESIITIPPRSTSQEKKEKEWERRRLPEHSLPEIQPAPAERKRGEKGQRGTGISSLIWRGERKTHVSFKMQRERKKKESAVAF